MNATSPNEAAPSPVSSVSPEPTAFFVPPRDVDADGSDDRALAGLRILVVDDDDDARDLFCTALGQRHADVLSARSAAEAFELLRHEQPALLVSDIAMPEEDGLTLIRKVRALPVAAGGLTPAVAVTAFAAAADRKRALEAGFDRYLSKPVDLGQLVRILTELSRRSG